MLKNDNVPHQNKDLGAVMPVLKIFDPDQRLNAELARSQSGDDCRCDPEIESQCPLKSAQAKSEQILQTIHGEESKERLVLVYAKQDGGSVLVLRQQSYAEGIGWFNQCSVEVTEAQVGPLLMALQTSPKVSAVETVGTNTTKLRIVS